MIKITRTSNTDPAKEYVLLINDEPILDVHIRFEGGVMRGSGTYELRPLSIASYEALISYSFNNFPVYKGETGIRFPISAIRYNPSPEELGLITQIEISEEVVIFKSTPNLADWNKPYGFSDYCKEASERINAMDDGDMYYSEFYNGSDYVKDFTMRFSPPADDIPIKIYISKYSDIIRETHEEVVGQIISRFSSHSIIASFKDFPKEVRAYCEQYLTYFIKFLQDLGVEATSEIKREAGMVLFTVTPKNEYEALDKIRSALNTYLKLPYSPVSTDHTNEIAIQRLESQILRFQSDIKLAAAELQAKNATIEAQQLTINVQKALLHGDIFSPRMKQIEQEKKEDREEFLNGTVALTVYKDKGLEVNLAKMYRQLKDLFMEKDEEEKPSD